MAETDPVEARLAEALEERARLWDQAHRAAALERDLEHTRRLMDEMQRSISWRLTTPLRGVKAAAGPRAKLAAELIRRGRARIAQDR